MAVTGISDLDNFSFARGKECVIIGPFSPIEGGIAQYNSLLAEKLEKSGWKVHKIQYYHYLWGQRLKKSTLKEETDNILSLFNPLSWVRVRNYISVLSPDVVIMKRWVPHLDLMYSIICPKWIKRLVILDNIKPHEYLPLSDQIFKVFVRCS